MLDIVKLCLRFQKKDNYTWMLLGQKSLQFDN